MKVRCPRCAQVVLAEFFGPCEDCREYLARGTWTEWFMDWHERTKAELEASE